VESRVGHGTTVTMHFPAARTSAPAAVLNAVPSPVATGREQVLLVEDDEAIRSLATRVLQRGGYHVTVAEDGESAAEQLRARGASGASPFALVVSDVVMPRGGGARVLDAMRQHAPATRLLWVTGYPGLDPRDGAAHAPSDAPLVQKPWTATELLQQVRAAIDGGTPLVA
jgi:two-component system, cell cycle sensor histidine kinase and response regulator CckA